MANWRRKLPNPIYLVDGTILVTLRDAANWIIDHQPSGSETAIERLIDAAEKGGSVETAEAAVQDALIRKIDFKRS